MCICVHLWLNPASRIPAAQTDTDVGPSPGGGPQRAHMVRSISTAIVCGGISCLLGACTAPRPDYVVTDPDPGVKIPAIKQSVARHADDAATVRQLVKDLDSDDPAVRFYAIEALCRLTGERKGYNYFESDPEVRRPAVDRWRAWVIDQGMTMPQSLTGVATQPLTR